MLIAVYAQLVYKRKILTGVEKNLQQRSSLVSLNFINGLNNISKTLSVIAETPPIQGIIRSERHGGVDPEDNSTLAFWESRLQVIFSAFLETSPSFTQIRFLDRSGQELVRVNRQSDGTIVPVPSNELQKKAKEPYFHHWKQKGFPPLDISAVTPNKEAGVVQYPVGFTMRVMKRVDKDGVLFGMLIINLDYERFVKVALASLAKNRFLNTQDRIIFLNDTDAFFVFQDNQFSFDFEKLFEPNEEALKRYKDEIRRSDKEKGFIYEKNKIIYFSKVYYDKAIKNRYIYVINEAKLPGFFSLNDPVTRKILLMSLVLFLVSFIVITWLVNRIFKPLADLASAVTESNKTKQPLSFPYQLPEEVDVLKKAILAKEKQLLDLATYDALTGALNRRSLLEQFKQILKDDNGLVVVFFIDIDNFKHVNDFWGHPVGDAVLGMVYKRLFDLTGKKGLIGRIGGDEFVVVRAGFRNDKDIAEAAREYRDSLSQKFKIEQKTIRLDSSIGVAIYPEHAKTPDTLLKYADYTMYQVKIEGKGGVKLFSPALKQLFKRRNQIEKELKVLLKNNQIDIYYQPQFCATTGKLYGIEALARWPKESKVFSVLPEECIAVAEEFGLIVSMGYYMLEKAMSDYMTSIYPVLAEPIRLSINVSAIQLREMNFLGELERIIRNTQFKKEWLILEITEQKLLTNFRCEQGTLKKLRASGIGLALDDFGVGYASLRYIRDIPFSALKIDKSLVGELDAKNETIKSTLKFTIQFAKSLGMKVIAEGVENEEQLNFLREYGCDVIQGYVFERAIPLTEFIERYGPGSLQIRPPPQCE